MLRRFTLKDKTMTSRDSLDRYYTPDGNAAIALLMQHLPLGPHLHLLEPCAGLGALVYPLLDLGHTVDTADLDPKSMADLICDAGSYQWPRERYDGIITNPPFKIAPQLVRHWLDTPRYFTACLLRLTFMESCKDRADLLRQGSGLWRVLVTPRYKFKGQGTDSVTTAWFIWRRGYEGTPQLIPYDDTQPAQQHLI